MKKVYYANTLKHYSSEYYDPVKAHEYYEQHKNLKGKHDGRKLNEKGQEAKAYVTDQINQKIKSTKEQASKDVESYSTQTKAQIETLKMQVLSMSKEELKTKGKQIQSKIAALKDQNNRKREEILNKMKTDVEGLGTTKETEIDKIYNDSETSEATKSKSSSASSAAEDTTTKHMSKEEVDRIHKMSERMKKDKKTS